MKFATPGRQNLDPKPLDAVIRPFLAAARASFHARAVKVSIITAAMLVMLIVVWPFAILWAGYFAYRGLMRARKRGKQIVQTTVVRAKK